MRSAFWLLLLVNLALLAWVAGGFPAAEEGREPERLARQIRPEALRIASATEVAQPVDGRTELICKRIAGLKPVEAESLAKALEGRNDWQIVISSEELPTMHWVVIAALPNRATAEKKRDELRLLGIGDLQIVDHEIHGPFAISLAMLPDEASANERLQALQRKGVRSARILPLKQAARSMVELRAPAKAMSQKLPDLITLLGNPGVDDCATP